MKRFIFILLAVTAISCSKEDDCNCGTIVNDEIINSQYTLSVKSDCSGNTKTFVFDYNTWVDNYVGGEFCVHGEDGW